MKVCVLCLTFCLILFGCDKNPNQKNTDSSTDVKQANPATAQSAVASSQEEELVYVKGTRAAMIPPEGFIEADGFTGFMLPENNASIIIIEVPASYSEVVEGFTKENFAKQRLLLLGKEELLVDNKQAILVRLVQKSGTTTFNKFTLAFGTEEQTLIINAAYPSDSENLLAQAMKESILSTRYYDPEPNYLDDSLTFSIKECEDFKILTVMANTTVLTLGGATRKSPHDPVFLVGKSLSEDVTIDKQKEFAIEKLYTLRMINNHELKSISEISINGLNGYQVKATGMDPNDGVTSVSVSLILLYDQDGYYFMIGIVGSDLEEKFSPSFMKIAESFTIKIAAL